MGKNNKILLLGILAIVLGITLFIYSLLTYVEINALSTKINFDELENNNKIPDSDKYYQHIQINDYLTRQIEKNKKLLIKNASCQYVEYAEHNLEDLYDLVFEGTMNDKERQETVENSVQTLYESIGNYRMCKNTPIYKKRLEGLIEKIAKHEDYGANNDVIMETFLNGSGEIEQIEDIMPEDENNQEVKPHEDPLIEKYKEVPPKTISQDDDEIKDLKNIVPTLR